MNKTHIKKLSIIILLVAIGILFQIYGVLDVQKLFLIVSGYTDQWWLIVVLIVLQIILFTFALAGSLVFWVVAPLYPPLISTLIVSVGAMLGGVGAYYFSKYITDDWIKKIEKSQVYKVLHKEDNFFTLFALRVFPGFPHSLVNYSSGILQVKLSHFMAAAFLGVGIKSYIYAGIIYNLSTTATIKDLLNFSTIAPLVLLSSISLAGVFMKYKYGNKSE